ncbi:MAG: zinc-binding dehydrogenase [Comamonadaceae bacterium]|nr:zinc-binding dehydrogenase [Comamonadaceae bacterium]
MQAGRRRSCSTPPPAASGLIACQWAKALGATVIGTVGSEEKAALAARARLRPRHRLHAARTSSQRVQARSPAARACRWSTTRVGKDTFAGSLDCLQPRGMMVTFGNASGPVPPFDLAAARRRRARCSSTRPTLMHYIGQARRPGGAGGRTVRDACRCRARCRIEVNQTYALKDAAQRPGRPGGAPHHRLDRIVNHERDPAATMPEPESDTDSNRCSWQARNCVFAAWSRLQHAGPGAGLSKEQHLHPDAGGVSQGVRSASASRSASWRQASAVSGVPQSKIKEWMATDGRDVPPKVNIVPALQRERGKPLSEEERARILAADQERYQAIEQAKTDRGAEVTHRPRIDRGPSPPGSMRRPRAALRARRRSPAGRAVPARLDAAATGRPTKHDGAHP